MPRTIAAEQPDAARGLRQFAYIDVAVAVEVADDQVHDRFRRGGGRLWRVEASGAPEHDVDSRRVVRARSAAAVAAPVAHDDVVERVAVYVCHVCAPPGEAHIRSGVELEGPMTAVRQQGDPV